MVTSSKPTVPALAGKGKRPPRGQRIHRRRTLALQRRAAKGEAVTSRN